MDGDTYGEIEIEGQTLKWNWEVELIEDDEDGTSYSVEWEDVEEYAKQKILTDILDNECNCGCW